MRVTLALLCLWTVAARGDKSPDLPDGCDGLKCNCTLGKQANMTGWSRHHTVKYRISRAVDYFDLMQECYQKVLSFEQKTHSNEADDKIDQLKDWLKGNESKVWSETGESAVHNATRDAKKEYKEAVEQAKKENKAAKKQPGADNTALNQQLHDKKKALEQQKDAKIKAAKQQAHTQFESAIAPKKQAFEEQKKAIEDKRAEKNKASLDSYKQKIQQEEQAFEQDITQAAQGTPGHSRAAISAGSDRSFDGAVLIGCVALVAAVVMGTLWYSKSQKAATVEPDYGAC